jgi:hypothetical protein
MYVFSFTGAHFVIGLWTVKFSRKQIRTLLLLLLLLFVAGVGTVSLRVATRSMEDFSISDVCHGSKATCGSAANADVHIFNREFIFLNDITKYVRKILDNNNYGFLRVRTSSGNHVT